jgi:hypothetical protein
LAIFDYARYFNEFFPPVLPYNYKKSKYTKINNNLGGDVEVSGILTLT